MIDLDSKQLERVKMILKRHIPERRVWVFGSRARGTAKPYSDLDLAVEGAEKLSFETRRRLQEDFEESDLPIRVDLVELCSVDPAFKQLIEKQRTRLQ